MKPRPIGTLFVIPTRLSRRATNLQCAHNSCRSYHISTALAGLTYAQGRNRLRARTESQNLHSTACRLIRYELTSSAATAKKPSTRDTSSTKPRGKLPASAFYKGSTRLIMSAKSPTIELSDKLNPPHSTYAPELSVPSRKADQGTFGYLYSAGKAYVAFYKQGIKNTWSTYKLAKQLRKKERIGRAEQTEAIAADVIKKVPKNGSKKRIEYATGVRNPVLTRAESEIIRRSHADMKRLPAFALLVLLFGEWLPLFVLWLTPVVPEPCRIPKQVTRDLQKVEKRREGRLKYIQLHAFRFINSYERQLASSSASSMDVPNPATIHPADVKDLPYFPLLMTGAKLDCYTKYFMVPMVPPRNYLKTCVRDRLSRLTSDDCLIERDGGWQKLGMAEVRRACLERGYDVLGKSDSELREKLKEWFEGTKRRERIEDVGARV